MPPMFNTYNNAQQTPLVHHPQEPGLGNPPSRGHIQSLNSSTRHPDVAAILPTGYGLPKPSVDPRSLSNKGTSSPSNASTPPQRGVLSVGANFEDYKPTCSATLDPSSNVAQAHSSGHSRPSQNSTFQENSRAPQLITTQTVHRPSQYQNGSLSQPKPFSIILSLSPSRPSLAIPPQSRVTSVIKDSPITSGTSSRASSTARRRPGKRPKDLSIATEIPSSSKDNLRAGHLGYAGKKRGRHLKTGEAGVKAAAIKASTYSKMAGQLSRPRKRWEHTEVPVPEPIYYAFICEWKGCVAELQNLETLRRHLLVIHGMKQENGRIACLWRNCRKAGEVTQEVAASDSDEVVQVPVSEPLEFLTRHSWKDHIQIHIQHIAQYMGDGPKGTYLDTKPPKPAIDPWLFDASGNQVTPSVDNRTEGGRALYNNRKRWKQKGQGRNAYWVPTKSWARVLGQNLNDDEKGVESGPQTETEEATEEDEPDGKQVVNIDSTDEDKEEEEDSEGNILMRDADPRTRLG